MKDTIPRILRAGTFALLISTILVGGIYMRPASAGYIFDFDRDLPTTNAGSFLFNVGNLTLTVTGQTTYTSGSITTSANVNWDGDPTYEGLGLGVRSRRTDTNAQIGNLNVNFGNFNNAGITFSGFETLRFEFSQSVTLLETFFTNVDASNDDFRLFVDGTQRISDRTIIRDGLIQTGVNNNAPVNSGFGVEDLRTVAGLSGTVFEFRGTDATDDFRIRQLVVVPEPEGLALLGLGLVALGLSRRRRM